MHKPELAALTGIRFYAAFLVYLSHVTLIPGMAALSGQRVAFNAGVVGVSFFFVLSGFILTYNYADLFRSGVSGANYKRFVWDRLTKIYPVHFATLLLVLPIAVFSPNQHFDWRAVPFHLLLLHCFWPFSKADLGSYLNVPSWSISCEWFFYLLAPIAMFLVLGGFRQRFMMLAIAAAYACGLGIFLWNGQTDDTRLIAVSWFAPSRFSEFLVGVFLARYFLSRGTRKGAALAGLVQAAGILLILAGAIYRAHAPWPFWGGVLYVPGSALLIIGLADGRGLLSGHLSRPWLNRLGMASFSLYLVHAPILRAAKGVCLRLGWEVHSWTVFYSVTVVMFLLVQGVALVMHSRYELPLQKRLRSRVAFMAVPAHSVVGA